LQTKERRADPDSPEMDDDRQAALRILARFTAVELELAATADFLSKHGYGDDAWTEMQRRKASKMSPERLARARQLLNELTHVGSTRWD